MRGSLGAVARASGLVNTDSTLPANSSFNVGDIVMTVGYYRLPDVDGTSGRW